MEVLMLLFQVVLLVIIMFGLTEIQLKIFLDYLQEHTRYKFMI